MRQSKFPLLRDKEWLRKKYLVEKLSTKEIAELIGTTPGNIKSHLKWANIQTRNIVESLKVKYPDGSFGELASNWRGGRRVMNKAGYIGVYSPNHPYKTLDGYVMEHRLVMEKKIGRYLKRTEYVHHINGKKYDNRIGNLELMGSKKEHSRRHFDAVKEVDLLKKIIVGCPQCSRKLAKNLV